MRKPRQAENIVTSEVFDELVAYAPSSSQAVSLNASARAIWELCDGSRTFDEICAELAEAAGVPADALRTDVATAIDKFHELGLVENDGA
jgi:hypothetical protein